MGLFILFLSSFIYAPHSYAKPVVIERLEASVNSGLILKSDLQEFRSTEKLRTQLDPLFNGTPLASSGKSAKNEEIIKFLVNEKIISLKFPVSDGEVEQEINSIQSSNRLTRDTLKRAITDQGFSFSQYFELIRISTSKRNLIDREIRPKVSISEDDILSYYAIHYPNSAPAPKSYHLKIISISTKSFKKPALAQEAAVKARSQIKKPDDFEEVARSFSDGPTASTGGELGVLSEEQMSPLIREALKKLNSGEVSPVFGSIKAGGFFILKLAGVQLAESERYQKIKEEIRAKLATTEYQRQIDFWLEREKQTASVHLAPEEGTVAPPAPSDTPSAKPGK